MAIRQAENKNCPLIVPDLEHKEKILGIIDSLMQKTTNGEREALERVKSRVYTWEESEEFIVNAIHIVIDDMDVILGRLLNVDPNNITITTL